jgi:hypothetical protein
MKLQGQLSVGLFDILIVGRAANAEQFIVVFLGAQVPTPKFLTSCISNKAPLTINLEQGLRLLRRLNGAAAIP